MVKPLVFLHGWAQSQQVWFQQRHAFPDAIFLNLPGHGGAEVVPAEQWLAYLLQQLPEEPCLLVGWSLGGMLAMQLALHAPQRVAALALVATTPSFRMRDGWSYGSDDALFQAFRDAAEADSPRLLNRFFTLMLHGDQLPRRDYNALAKAAVDRERRVQPEGLMAGLQLLELLDLRGSIGLIHQPVLLLHGQNDAIIPVASSQWMAAELPHSDLWLQASCGHAPFLTYAEQFNTTLDQWWQAQ